VQSAFYWGYSLGQIPASRLIHKYGGKWIFGLSVLIPSLLTLLVPEACKHSLAMALFVRAILGFFESATFPAIFYYFPIWVPLEEKVW
jgi:MFS family permease